MLYNAVLGHEWAIADIVRSEIGLYCFNPPITIHKSSNLQLAFTVLYTKSSVMFPQKLITNGHMEAGREYQLIDKLRF